jgi:hypothetical protein
VLAPNSDALFAKELSDLLVSLEVAIPGYGMEIARVLVGKASEDNSQEGGEVSQKQKKEEGHHLESSATACLMDPFRVAGLFS